MYDGYKFEVIAQVDGHYPQDQPYPPVPAEAVLGDCWHRFYVRMLEVVQSMRLDPAGDGEVFAGRRRRRRDDPLEEEAAQGRGVSGNRSPQGPDGIHDHQRRLGRAVAGADSQQQFLHTSVMPELCRGVLVADVPAIVGSLDLVLGEIDR